MLKKLFSQTAIYGLAPQIPKIATVISLPLITPFLTEIDFGVYGVVMAVVGGLTALQTLGLIVILSNSFYKSPGMYKWAWRQIYGFLIVWNFPFAFLLAGTLYLFLPEEASNNFLWIMLLNVLPVVFFGPTANIGYIYYQLNQKPIPIAVRSVIIGLLAVGLNIYLIAFLKLGYMGWFISLCFSSVLSNISYWFVLNIKLGITPIFNFKRRFIKNALRVSLPIIPHSYAAFILNSSDRLIMKGMNISTASIGLYSVANTVANLVDQIGVAMGRALTPLMYSSYKKDADNEARDLIFVSQVVLLTTTFILSIWLKEAFEILIKNESLQNVYPLGIILLMAYNYKPMYLGANNKLFYTENTKFLLKVSLVAAIGNLILNLIFIPLYGYGAAAYTTFAALMYMGYSGYYFKIFKRINTANYYPLYWLLTTILLTILAYFIVDLSIVTRVLITFLTLMCGVFLIKKLR